MKDKEPVNMTFEVAQTAEAWVRIIQLGTPAGRRIVQSKRIRDAEYRKSRPLA